MKRLYTFVLCLTLIAALSSVWIVSNARAEDNQLSAEEIEIIEFMEFLDMMEFLESDQDIVFLNNYEKFEELYSEVEYEQ